MAEISWVKITVDMFDNRKIKHLRKLPEGNNIILIWVMLLTMAGRCNANGMIYLTENIPYTNKMLADELGFEESTIELAIASFEQLDMLRRDDFLCIAGWEEYQNIDGMEKIREQNRLRKQRQREKLLLERDCHVTVTGRHATDLDLEVEEDVDREEDIEILSKPTTNTTVSSAEAPTLEEVKAFAAQRKSKLSAISFYEKNSKRNWEVNGKKIENWQALFVAWEKNEGGYTPPKCAGPTKIDLSELKAIYNRI